MFSYKQRHYKNKSSKLSVVQKPYNLHTMPRLLNHSHSIQGKHILNKAFSFSKEKQDKSLEHKVIFRMDNRVFKSPCSERDFSTQETEKSELFFLPFL